MKKGNDGKMTPEELANRDYGMLKRGSVVCPYAPGSLENQRYYAEIARLRKEAIARDVRAEYFTPVGHGHMMEL